MDHPAELEFAWLMFTGITLMCVLALAMVLFFVYYQRRLFRQQTALEKQKLEEQRKLLKAEIVTQENERERIARDLHDEVGALLSTIKLFYTAEKMKSELPADTSSPIEPMLDEAVHKLRSISHNLLPENLKQFGLINAIEYYCRQLEASGFFTVRFYHQISERLPDEQEILLYRIIQELFNNAIKHAGATEINLSLRQHANSTLLNYEDNGIGFNKNETKQQPSLGLSTLSSRVQLLNGKLDIISAPQQGVQVNITF